MSLAWLLPLGFAVLAAWLLPLLIHLARRSEHRITDFAALRWLSAISRPRRRLRFDDWPLLLLRLLLIAAIAALLARPVLFGAPDRRPWLVATPPITAAQLRAAAPDASTQLRWLAPGFPDIDALHVSQSGSAVSAAASAASSTASLLRELDAMLPAGTPLTVLTPQTLDGADAERPRLSRWVDWQVVPDASTAAARSASSANTDTYSAPPPRVMVRSASDRDPALRYLRAVDVVWSTARSRSISAAIANRERLPADDISRDASAATTAPGSTVRPAATGAQAASASAMRFAAINAPLDADTPNLIWLAAGALPEVVRDWIAAGGSALIAADAVLPTTTMATTRWRDDNGIALVRESALGRGRVLQWARPLSPVAMPQLLDARFPQHLRALFAASVPAPGRVDAQDYAPLTGATAFAETPRPLDGWLIALIALLFAIERWLAGGRPRGGVLR
ncbi:MAG: BatA domain-containing protein [Luteimonas sp.]